MRSRPKASRTMTAVGGAGLLGLAFLAAPALGRVFEDGPPREHPAPPAPPAPPEGGDEEEAVDAMTKRVQDLAERLTRQAEPVADEVRKAIGDAASALGDTLRRDDASTEDIKSALERARDELTRAFREGGAVDRSARDAIRKAQEEVRDNLEKSRRDAREALRRRYDVERERLGAMADEVKDKVEEAADAAAPDKEIERQVEAEFRDDPEIAALYDQKREIERRLDRVRKGQRKEDDPSRKAHEAHLDDLKAEIEQRWKDRYHEIRGRVAAEAEADAPDEAAKPAAEGDDRDRAQRRVRDLQQQLREAQRELQQADRRGPGPRKPIPFRGRFGPMRPGPGPGARPSPEADRRLDALEAKMDRVLQALEGLKAEKPEGDDMHEDEDEDKDE